MHFWGTAILTPPTPGNCEVTKIAIQKHLGISEWVYLETTTFLRKGPGTTHWVAR